MNEARCEFLKQFIILRAQAIEAHAGMLKLGEDDGTNPAVCAVKCIPRRAGVSGRGVHDAPDPLRGSHRHAAPGGVMNEDTKLIRAHEKALDRVMRANMQAGLTEKQRQAALDAGVACGLSLRESQRYLAEAIRCSD